MRNFFLCIPGVDGGRGVALLIQPDYLASDLKQLAEAEKNGAARVEKYNAISGHIPGVDAFSGVPLGERAMDFLDGRLMDRDHPVRLTEMQAMTKLGLVERDCVPPGEDGHCQLLCDAEGNPWENRGEPCFEVRFEGNGQDIRARVSLAALRQSLAPVVRAYEAERAAKALRNDECTRPSRLWLPGGDGPEDLGMLVRLPESAEATAGMLEAFADMEAWAGACRNAILDAPEAAGFLRSIPMTTGLFPEAEPCGAYDPKGTEIASTGASFDPRAVQLLTEDEAERVLIPCGPKVEAGKWLRQTFEIAEQEDGRLAFSVGLATPQKREADVAVQIDMDELRAVLSRHAAMLREVQEEPDSPRP